MVFRSPRGYGCCPFLSGGSVVVDSLLIVTPILGFCYCSMFCCALLCVHSSFAIILVGKREQLVALLCLSSWCFRDCCVALPHDAMAGLEISLNRRLPCIT